MVDKTQSCEELLLKTDVYSLGDITFELVDGKIDTSEDRENDVNVSGAYLTVSRIKDARTCLLVRTIMVPADRAGGKK